MTSTVLRTSTINPPGGTTGGGQGNQPSKSSTSLPPPTTAPASIDGGGTALRGGAPVPGATAPGGVYGPDDDYIAAALAHHANLMFVGITGVAAGAALLVL